MKTYFITLELTINETEASPLPWVTQTIADQLSDDERVMVLNFEEATNESL
jgi:hypothetical protein